MTVDLQRLTGISGHTDLSSTRSTIILEYKRRGKVDCLAAIESVYIEHYC